MEMWWRIGTKFRGNVLGTVSSELFYVQCEKSTMFFCSFFRCSYESIVPREEEEKKLF